MGLVVEKTFDAGPGEVSCDLKVNLMSEEKETKAVMDLETQKEKCTQKCFPFFKKRTFHLLFCFQISLRGQYKPCHGGAKRKNCASLGNFSTVYVK